MFSSGGGISVAPGVAQVLFSTYAGPVARQGPAVRETQEALAKLPMNRDGVERVELSRLGE